MLSSSKLFSLIWFFVFILLLMSIPLPDLRLFFLSFPRHPHYNHIQSHLFTLFLWFQLNFPPVFPWWDALSFVILILYICLFTAVTLPKSLFLLPPVIFIFCLLCRWRYSSLLYWLHRNGFRLEYWYYFSFKIIFMTSFHKTLESATRVFTIIWKRGWRNMKRKRFI